MIGSDGGAAVKRARGFEGAALFFENLHRAAELQLVWLEQDCDHFRDAVSISPGSMKTKQWCQGSLQKLRVCFA